jgi:hypothetical protein
VSSGVRSILYSGQALPGTFSELASGEEVRPSIRPIDMASWATFDAEGCPDLALDAAHVSVGEEVDRNEKSAENYAARRPG